MEMEEERMKWRKKIRRWM
jgi:hypothetical protein